MDNTSHLEHSSIINKGCFLASKSRFKQTYKGLNSRRGWYTFN